MRLTPTLLGHLNRVFEKDPGRFVALRIRYAGAGMTWAVADGILTTQVSGGVGTGLSIDLSQYTLSALAARLAGAAGYEVDYIAADAAGLSALVLLDGAGDQSVSNGDRLLGYTSLLWAFMESFAAQLQVVATQIGQMVRQLSTTTAEGAWLDELGGFYGVVRGPGELDVLYGPRIIAEVVRPLSNNIAMELAIQDYTGQAVTVTNVTIFRGVAPLYDGSITFNGANNYDTPGHPNYGLFDVGTAYDLIGGGDIAAFLASVQAIVERLRAAGTHLRALALVGASAISDDFTAPDDDLSTIAVTMTTLSDTMSAPDDGGALALSASISEMTDALTAPTDDATGSVFGVFLTDAGDPVLTDAGDPILFDLGPLFI